MAEWDRRDTETEQAYAAFHHFLFMPRPRTIDAAFQSATGAQRERNGKRAYGHWTRWSSRHEWLHRAAQYDAHLAKQDELLWEERRRQKREREWNEAEQIRDVLEEAIPHARQFIRRQTAYIRGQNGAPDREIITVEYDIVGLTTVAEKLQRIQNLVLGDSTENVNLSGAALIGVIEAELRRLAAVADEPTAPTALYLTADEDEQDAGAAPGDAEMQA